MLRVDVLNCMGLGLGLLAALAMIPVEHRVKAALLAGVAVAALSPMLGNSGWGQSPGLLQEYLSPAPGRRFPQFPWAAYLAFGIAVGTLVKRAAVGSLERLMQWSVLAGTPLIFAVQYFANLPYSIYERSNFWIDSPALPLIRLGIILLTMAGAYLWTEYGAGSGWSWMQTLGKNSLMVYWVHVMIVYGSLVRPIKRRLSFGEAALAILMITGAMLLLSEGWLRWKLARQAQKKPAPV
jgi:fucose 4-O-acetylase-like acetyltransferase